MTQHIMCDDNLMNVVVIEGSATKRSILKVVIIINCR